MVATAERPKTRRKGYDLSPRRETWLRENGYAGLVDEYKAAVDKVPLWTPSTAYARWSPDDLLRFLQKAREKVGMIERALADKTG